MTDSHPSVRELDEGLLTMLREGRKAFDIAVDLLLSRGDVDVVREDVYRTDQGINRLEREIRRRLVVHGAVHGANVLPGMLVLMSLVKDAERIGDYAKNILELAACGVTFAEPRRRSELVERKNRVSEFLERVVQVVDQHDEAAATALLDETRELSRTCDADVTALLRDVHDRNPAGEVLLLRYLKRIANHAGNVASSVVVPVDRLDFRPKVPDSEQ